MTTSTALRSRLELALLYSRQKQKPLTQQGFTLVELMIVIVIVGVLSAVALPNFIGQKNKAEAGSLIGSMVGFAKECQTNVITADSTAQSIPSTITKTGTCDGTGDVTFVNATAFPDATKIKGVRCATNSAGEAQTANGTAHNTCTLTVSSSGALTGAWS
jgi:type IV pilus assembly protein PilA